MLNIIGLRIEINRGNAAGLTFHFNGDDAPENGTEVLFQVACAPCNNTMVIEKRATVDDKKITISFNREDTENLKPGLYYWNACIQYENGLEPWTVLRDWQTFLILPG